jgi:hypothetical protein
LSDKNILFNMRRLYNIAKRNASLHIVTLKYRLKSGCKKLLRRAVEFDCMQEMKLPAAPLKRDPPKADRSPPHDIGEHVRFALAR